MPTKTTTWEHVKKDVLENYSEYLRGDGKAERTIDSYLSDVARFLDYHYEHAARSLEDTIRADVTEFLAHIHTLGLIAFAVIGTGLKEISNEEREFESISGCSDYYTSNQGY